MWQGECLNYAHLFGLEQNPSIIVDIDVDIRKHSHCKAYSRFDAAILDKPCKASPHDAVLQT
jgi:hypothetical protein